MCTRLLRCYTTSLHCCRLFAALCADTQRSHATQPNPISVHNIELPCTLPPSPAQVHRGVYEAAKVLYDRFLPLIYEHLDSSPFARITFTVSEHLGVHDTYLCRRTPLQCQLHS